MDTVTNVIVGAVTLAASVYIGDKIGTYVIGKHGGALTSTQKVTYCSAVLATSGACMYAIHYFS